MMKCLKVFLGFYVLIACTFNLNAEDISINSISDSLYVFDNFDLKGPGIVGDSSGFGWNGGWGPSGTSNRSFEVINNSLSYPAAVEIGSTGGSVANRTTSGIGHIRQLINGIKLDESKFYVSFLAQKSSTGFFRIDGGDGQHVRYSVGVKADGKLEINAANRIITSSESFFENDKTYLIVACWSYDTNANLKMVLFEEGDVIPETDENLDWDLTDGDDGGITGVILSQFRFAISFGNVCIDEFRLGSTFNSVTNSGMQAPSDLSLTPDIVDISEDISTTLSWTDHSDNENGFIIVQDNVIIDSVPANTTSYVLHGFDKVSDYKLEVMAYNNMGYSKASNTAIFTLTNSMNLTNIMHPPEGSVEYTTIPYFAWQDVPEGQPYPGSYIIQIAENDVFSSLIDVDTISAMVNHYSPNFELDYGKTYYWRVAYVNDCGGMKPWSEVTSFHIKQPEVIIEVNSSDGWSEIRSKFQQAVNTANESQGVELRFPENHTFKLQQQAGELRLFESDGATNVIINGNGSKLIIEKSPVESDCSVLWLTNSSNIQFKNFVLDYAKNSIGHFAGVISDLDKENISFTVTVDTTIYKNFDEIRARESIETEGTFFVDSEDLKRVTATGEKYPMKEKTWTEAQSSSDPTKFYFTKPDDTTAISLIMMALKNGDIAATGYRGGDLIRMTYSKHIVVNDVISYAARNRTFIPGTGSKYIRAINVSFLRGEGRYFVAAAGGVGVDASHYFWMEGCRFENCHDDTYHSALHLDNGIDAYVVLKNNEMISGHRNSIWLNGNRNWIVGNRIENGGLGGIRLGRAAAYHEIGYQVSGAVIEDNIIINTAHNEGIWTHSRGIDPVSGRYNEYITIRNNKVIDNNDGRRAYNFTYLKNGIIKNNQVLNQNLTEFNVYTQEDQKAGFYFNMSDNVKGDGNVVEDSRLSGHQYIVVDNSTSIDFKFRTPDPHSVDQ